MAVIARDIYIVETRGVKELAELLKAAAKAAGKVGDETKKAGEKGKKGTDEATKGAGRLKEAFRAAAESLTPLNQGLELAAKLGKTAAAAFRKIALEPIGLAVSFEREFALVQTLTDKAGAEMERGLLDLAERVPQTAGDITKAAYQAISAGIDPTQVVQFLDSASKTAVASNASLTESVDALVTTVNAYKDSGVDAARASEILFNTVVRGRTTMSEMTSSLGAGVPAAAAFGVSMGEVAAAVATLTKQGQSTSEAMTLINATIKAIGKGKDKAVFEELGIQAGGAALQAKGLTGVLEDVLAKTGGNIDAIQSLSGRWEGVRALVGLLKNDMQGYRDDLRFITEETGALSRANEIMSGTTQGAINRFQALKEGVLRELGNQLLPTVNSFIEKITTRLREDGPQIAETLGKLLEALIRLGEWVIDRGGDVVEFVNDLNGSSSDAAGAIFRMEASILSVAGPLSAFDEKMVKSARSAGYYASALAQVNAQFESIRSAQAFVGPENVGAFTGPVQPRRTPVPTPAAAPRRGGGAGGRAARDFAQEEAQAVIDLWAKVPGAAAKASADARREIIEESKRLIEEVNASREAQQAREAAALVDAQRAAGLDPNNLDLQMEALRLRHEMEIQAAIERGENVTLLERQQLEERTEANRKHAEMQRLIWEANVGHVTDALSAGQDVLNAIGVQSQALARAEAAVKSVVNAGLAAESWGKAFAAAGSLNFWSAAKFTASALKHTAAAIMLGRAAAGGGARADGPGGSTGGGSGGPSQQAGRNRFQDPGSGRDQTLRPTFYLNFTGQPLETRTDIQDAVMTAAREAQKRLSSPVLIPASA